MKNLLEKLGFRRMDEMEHSIALRAQAYSFRFLAAALFLWSCWESWVVRPNGGSLPAAARRLLYPDRHPAAADPPRRCR